MWIVRAALRNPYTVGVLAVFIFLMGFISIKTMLVDVFPAINIPVVAVVWNYPGLSAQEMESRIVFVSERGYTTTVNSIERIESRSTSGVGVIRLFFQPDVDIGAAISQIASSSLTSMRQMPPQIQPPTIVQFNAANVPVAQLTITSDTIPEEKLFDYANNFARLRLFTLPGLSTPAPYGGKSRQINIDVVPQLLAAKGLSPQDIVNALNVTNLIIPAGIAHIGNYEYNVILNSSPKKVEQFANLPVKVVNGRPVLLGEVAKIADAYADQTNIARINGRRATFLNILKKSDASTLNVVNSLREELGEIEDESPPGMKYHIDFDQSVFVRSAVTSVVREGVIAAVLVTLMILLFLGSLRSVFIVCTSIPLSIFASIIGLKLTGNSLNIMTIGGLSLAIGMLVDDATVEIENIDRNKKEGDTPSLTVAILRGASQIALPAIMSTLAICIVFFPVTFLQGPARFLFTPMALSVIFAMLASYLLSRTLVPTLAELLMHGDLFKAAQDLENGGDGAVTAQVESGHGNGGGPDSGRGRHRGAQVHANSHEDSSKKPGAKHYEKFPDKDDNSAGKWAKKFNKRREKTLDNIRDRYSKILEVLLENRGFVLIVFALVLVCSIMLPFFVVGRDFFPTTDAGLMRIHFRAPSGTRLEETERLVAQAELEIRRQIPISELDTINSNIGVPLFYNLAFVPTDNVASMDAEILVSLKEGHKPTNDYVKSVRQKLRADFPGSSIYFMPADIVNQVLNFGLSAMIDVQVQAKQEQVGLKLVSQLRDKMARIPGATDVNISQVFDYPTLNIDVDRVRAMEMGVTQKDVASSMLISLSSSSLYAPSFYLNPENNVNYFVVAKVPMRKIATTGDLMGTPITPMGPQIPAPATLAAVLPPSVSPDAMSQGQAMNLPHSEVEPLSNLGSLHQTVMLDQVDHYNVQRIFDVTARAEDRDLGGVSDEIQKAIDDLGDLPADVKITLRGQSEIMNQSFKSLGLGLLLSIVLVYLLMVVLFQSWIDPFIVMIAIPGAFAGILWMLALTGTTLNVVSLMGSVMAVGIAVSNSILLVSFANELRTREKDMTPLGAALEAGRTRLRPVLMTSIAMILGMVPMALGIGEGGGQNAPLGRAVIGGLLFATVTTLLVVPVVYSLLRVHVPVKRLLKEQLKKDQEEFEKLENQEFAHGTS